MADYIKRADVLETLRKANIGGYITDRLLEITAADVKPIKHGKWIGVDYDTYFECSECKHRTDWQLYKYCPYCGARMNGDTE